MSEPTIYEMSSPGRIGLRFPEADVPTTALPEMFVREDLASAGAFRTRCHPPLH
jgi:glycine dehydrogenase subunit 2